MIDTRQRQETRVREDEKLIMPAWDIVIECMAWARQFPEAYTVYSAGILTYNDDADLTFFLIKWGDG